MEQPKFADLSDEALLKEARKHKSTKLYDAIIIGLLVGIAIYSAAKNGLGWLSLLPLVYMPIALKNNAKNKALETLLKERNLK
ncbi:FUSC family protein [Mariniflexile sp.]|uniref:FUSC family protein n=1 Tax=Mariniflexile sp. TaxID=1979402 RepID=UPI00356A4618